MKTQISAEVRAVIELDETERFPVTGRDEYGSVDYTIMVERVRHWAKKYPTTVGVKMSGRRVLKDGSVRWTNKTVAIPDGDERIPAAVVEAVTAMRERVAHLESYIAEEA